MSRPLFFVYYALVLCFGIALSFSFSGIGHSKKASISFISLVAGSGIIQILIYIFFSEDIIWKLYPIITHLPLGIVMHNVFHKKVSTIAASVSLSYLCHQPSKWFGLLFDAFTKSHIIEYIMRSLILITVAIWAICRISPYVSKLFNKETKSIFVFGGIPIIFYIYDYVTSVYTNLWQNNYNVASEFLPFLLCVVVIIFYSVYYNEYEKNKIAENKEHVVSIAMKQQSKELEAMKVRDTEIKILRHDMRHLLNNVATSIEHNDKNTALKLISAYISRIESTDIHRYCENDTLNYIIANCHDTCRELNIKFHVSVDIQELNIDMASFSTIVSNALENAINAQKLLPEKDRKIRFMLKTLDDKLLLSVKNPYKTAPIFVGDLPINEEEGHGYGTQSIKYMTERLGGKYQFSTQNDLFVLRIII